MSVNINKLRMIPETDYINSELKEGNDWYIGCGQFLNLTDKEYLLNEMEEFNQ